VTVYRRFADLADRILATDKGETGAIRRAVVAGGGPADPTGGTTATTDYPCRLVAFPVAQADVDGTLIKMGDFKVIVATGIDDAAALGETFTTDTAPANNYGVSFGGLSITPTTTDQIVCSAGVLTIIDAGKFQPTDTVTHYKMFARK
jgi:hypothetical protein